MTELALRLNALDNKYSLPKTIAPSPHPLNLPLPDFDRVVFDCEIIKAIPDRKNKPIPGIKYCSGWTDFSGMGVAVVGAKFNQEPARHYLSPQELLGALEGYCGVIVGYNSARFDDPLLAAHGCPIQTGYDLVCEIRSAAGLDRYGRASRGKPGYSLGAIAEANSLGGKTEDGAIAPVYWQRGDRQRVIDYCLSDVELTSQILDLGLQGNLLDPNTGNYLLLPVPYQHVPVIKPAEVMAAIKGGEHSADDGDGALDIEGELEELLY